MRYIPSNAHSAHRQHTMFGAKSVEFVPPNRSQASLEAGATVPADAVQLEVNTLVPDPDQPPEQDRPSNLNATMSAIAEGLRGHGDDFGATLAGLNQYLPQINPKMPTLETDFPQTAQVANIYGDAGARPRDGARQRPDHQQHDRRRAGQPELRRCCPQPAWRTTELRHWQPAADDLSRRFSGSGRR